MTKRNAIEIIRVPNNSTSRPRPQVFPRMPQLYLELLENKTKIRGDLVGVPYQHVYTEPVEPMDSVGSTVESDRPVEIDVGDEDRGNRSAVSSLGGSPESVASRKSEKSRGSRRSEKSRGSITVESVRSISVKSSARANDVSKRLEDILGADDDDETIISVKSDKYKKHRDRSGTSIEKKLDKAAPSYAELEAQGAYVPRQELRDISAPIKEMDRNTDDMKRELLFKFELLRKSYPESSIPEYSVHTDYKSMLISYEDCVRRLSLDSSVESYKQYLIYGFMALEFGLGKFFKLDMDGFTKQQIVSMSSYEKLLIELGEKSYVPEGSEWSVEVRLLGLVLMNTAFFVVSKIIISKTNTNLMEMMNKMTGGGSTAPQEGEQSGSSSGGSRMKPPEFNFSEL